MITILSLIGITTIWVLGLTVATQEGRVFYFIRKRLEPEDEENKKASIWDMVILCVQCMPTIHSLAGYVFAYAIGVIEGFNWGLVIIYPLVVCGSSFLSGLLWALYIQVEIYIGYLTHSERLTFFQLKDKKRDHHKERHNQKENARS